ncbi:predicted protein [Chaetoceros tenuissimus]|uniref:Uncharacterized protein n=1 Tax=Chaetoceros tenuissimus TaxID=426638 RepID=A0AAD3CPE0_9STRA|nr:predicted protein [Chaetoceros tenuissimus]
MSEGPDEQVKEEILSVVGRMTEVDFLRQNKIRKIVCKTIETTNWTQFQRVLEKLVEEGILQTKSFEGEDVIVTQKKEAESGKKSKSKKKKKEPKDPKVKFMKKDIQVPYEIILYLTRKGKKKQNNIEENTKTSLTFDNETVVALRNKSIITREKESTLSITKTWSNEHERGSEEEKEAYEKAKKQLSSAKAFIVKMVKSFQEHPERFAPKKAGGTFAEQAEEKKRQEEASKKKAKKGSKSATDDDLQRKKKRQRKFY